MRLLPLSLLLVLPLLAACDSGNTPKAPTASTPAATAPAKAPATKAPTAAVPATFPISARPLLGSWAAADCSDSNTLTVVSATTYSGGGKSCDIALTDNKDGTYAATCEGQKLSLTPIFGPTGEGIRIAAGDAKSTAVFRCSK